MRSLFDLPQIRRLLDMVARSLPGKYQFQQFFISALLLCIILSSCSPATARSPAEIPTRNSSISRISTPTNAPASIILPEKNTGYLDASLPVSRRAEILLSQMTLVDKNSIQGPDITQYFIGSLLSGGGESPQPNTLEAWAQMVDEY